MINFFAGMLESLEPFTVLLALLPLLTYLAIFGLIRASGHCLVTTGGRDIATLALAITGMLVVGPLELFFPAAAATVFGATVWIALAVFYALTVSLIALTSQPKLVVYGRTPEETYPALLRAVERMDSRAKGNPNTMQIHLPTVGVRLRVDGQRSLDSAKVLAFEPTLAPRFWNTLLGHLRAEMRHQTVPLPRRGLGMLIIAVLLASILVWQSFGNRELVVEGFRHWLWR